MQFENYLQFVNEACKQVYVIQKRWFRAEGLAVDMKPDDTPVTAADRESEQLLRQMIELHFPSHGIIGEEYGATGEGRDWVWVLDPIDGTKSFAAGVPLFGTLIALLREGEPLYGTIFLPCLNLMFCGSGSEALLNGKNCRLRACSRLSGATLLTTDISAALGWGKLSPWQKLQQSVGLMRTWGDCFGYAQVAAGCADIMMDPELAVWDKMALIPVLRGAGAWVGTWEGGDPVRGNSLLACAPELADPILALLNTDS